MKHLLIITTVFSIALTACQDKTTTGEQQSLMEVSKQELATALEERDQLLSLVMEISQSTDSIKHLENIMTISGTQAKEKPTQRSKLLNDIASLRQTMSQRRQHLAALEERLQKSTLYTDELKGTIGLLRRQIKNQSREIDHLRQQLLTANEQISTLNDEVDSLNSTVAAVNENLDSAQAISTQLSNELNTCYYVVATKAELKKHRILETGFLRKSKLLKGDFDKGFFNIGDKRRLTEIATDSDKLKIHTNHPAGSYEITGDTHKKCLRITNPDKFWSLTNYLVLQTD